jgi:hypothetical protein
MEPISVSVGGWTCVKNGIAEGTPVNLNECILAAGAAAAASHVLIGIVRPDPPSPPDLPSPPSPVGPVGQKTLEFIAGLDGALGYDARRADYIAGRTNKEPDVLVSNVKISRKKVGDPLLTITMLGLGHTAVVPVQECKMPDDTTAPGISADHLMEFLDGLLGTKASGKLKLGRTKKSRANLLVMPGLKKDLKFNKIHKKNTTVRLEYKKRCDMCGEVPRKSGEDTNACGASVLMPDGRAIGLYVCLDCPSGRMLVCGETVEVTKNLHRHSAHAKVVRAGAEPVAEPSV